MKSNASKTIFLVVGLFIFILLIFIMAYFIEIDRRKKFKICKNYAITTTTATTTKPITTMINGLNKSVIIDFDNETDYMKIGNDLFYKYSEDKYTVDLTINNIKLSGYEHNIEIKNFSPNDYYCEKGKDKVVYFDYRTIYEPFAEGCYITGLDEIIVFRNNFIILRFYSENGGWFKVFNPIGYELEVNEYISVAEIKSIDDEGIRFIGYEYDEYSDEPMCSTNEYRMSIKNGSVTYELLSIGEPQPCM